MKPTVTIDLNEYNRLLKVEQLLIDKPNTLCFWSCDGYKQGELYIDDRALEETKTAIIEIITDYKYPLNTPSRRKFWLEDLFSQLK